MLHKAQPAIFDLMSELVCFIEAEEWNDDTRLLSALTTVASESTNDKLQALFQPNNLTCTRELTLLLVAKAAVSLSGMYPEVVKLSKEIDEILSLVPQTPEHKTRL